ncbi:MAG: DUF4423 domain-containing protein [Bdellovibrionota bacterium]
MDFKAHLQRELVDRIKKNPNYSLRSFAKQLEIDASTLSKMLKGKRTVGRKSITQLGQKLGLSNKQIERFLDQESDGKDTPMSEYELLALDQFAVISDWYHFAIMELMHVDGFKPDHKRIAKSLGIKAVEVNVAVERLVRIGMLEIQNGKWIDRTSGTTTNIGPDVVSSAHRRLQEQLLLKAIAVQETVRSEERDHSAMTMAIDSKKISEAKIRIRKFRRSLTKFLTEGETKDSVFNLNIALFPLTTHNAQGEKYEL